MVRRREDAAHHLDVGAARHDPAEIDHELGRVVQDVGEVDVMTLRRGLVDRDLHRHRLRVAHGLPPAANCSGRRSAARAFALAAACLLAVPAARAQDSASQSNYSQTYDTYSGLNPYVVKGDAAYARRQDGRVGAVASPRRISEAIAAYQTAAEAPDNLEARWKLLRAYYFKGVFTGLDAESRLAVFSKARRVADDAIEILARRAGRAGGPDLIVLDPAARAEALAKDKNAAPTFFWSAVSWGQWALAVGVLQAATAGAAQRIRDDCETVIDLDPQFEEGGGYRVLGRLHDQAPQIPFLTGWVSREDALKYLRLAVSVSKTNFVNRHFLAEALAKGTPEERAEAIAFEEAIVASPPSPGHLVEDLALQEQAAHNLEEWKKSSAR